MTREQAKRTLYYYQKKAQARILAQDFQQDQNPKSWGQVAQEVAHLEKLAKKYGLVKEFKENGII